MISAEQARQSTRHAIDQELIGIQSRITASAANGKYVCHVDEKDLTEDMEKRLTELGYNVRTVRADVVRIIWRA